MSKALAADHHAVLDHHHEHEAGNTKLGIWVFLASECITFGALIGTYLSLYGRSVSGPQPKDLLNVPLTALATFILLASSFTMVMAIAQSRSGKERAAQVWLGLTIVLGAVFLGFQVKEYMEFIHHGLKLNTNLFSATFYTLTGVHGAHVAIGILWLIGVLVNSLRGKLGAATAAVVEHAGMYWHFVDMAWMVIFPVVYLIEFVR